MITFKTKQDQVADILRERIISGEYGRGDRLKQIDIAMQIGVSPTPVREALRVLEAEGYVVSTSHRGVVIPEFDFERTREVSELRILLETRLAAIAVSRVDDRALRDLKELQQLYARAAKNADQRELRGVNYRFHFRLYELAGSPQTLQFVRVLWAKFPFFRETIMKRLPKVVDQHDLFLDRLSAGDYDAAIEAMRHHIGEGWDEISRPIEKHV